MNMKKSVFFILNLEFQIQRVIFLIAYILVYTFKYVFKSICTNTKA